MPFRIRVSLAVILALLALLLIGPLVLPIPELDTVPPSALAGPDSRFVEVDGIEVHYLEAGRAGLGTPLLLLHGFGSGAHGWREVMPELAAHGRVIAFDRPAAGLTERPLPGEWDSGANPYSPEGQARLTLGLMDALGIDRAVLVGSSSGGTVALQLADQHPERVAGLVLVSPAVYRVGGPPRWLRPLLHTPHMTRLGPLLMRQLSGEAGYNFVRSAWADPDAVPQEAYDAYLRAFRVHGWDRALWELSKASHEPEFVPRLARLDEPTLVVVGAADQVVPPEESERLAADLPDATLAVMDGCGHLPQEECPAEFVQLVEPWLAQLPTGGRAGVD